MTDQQIKWHKGDDDIEERGWDAEPGEWYAEVGGVKIAHCTVNESVSTGYYGRYRGMIPGNRRFVTDSLTNFKAATATAWAAAQGRGEVTR